MDLIEELKLRHPIVQAPMAGVSSPAMAAAVSRAGGLGSLGVGAMDAETALGAIREARALGAQPLNVNVFCHTPSARDRQSEAEWLAALAPSFAQFGAVPPETLSEIYSSFAVDDAMLEMLVQERPEVVSLHFGLPDGDRLAALKDAGILVLVSATSVAEARDCLSAGVDAIVAQGIEAGGHRGMFDPTSPDEELPTLELVRRIILELDAPVIAAGGLMTGEDIHAALQEGAVAAQLGTAFIACDESLADTAYRAALRDPACQPPVLTPVLSGRPARCLSNRFVALAQSGDLPETPGYPVTYDAGKALNAAAKAAGETGFGAQWSGMGAIQVRDGPASEIMAQLVRELEVAPAG